MRLSADLPLLTETERSCLERYLDLLVEQLGDTLVDVAVYGSVARGESWPPGMPIRSDLDLLVVTSVPVSKEAQSELVDATMPLFLESGRQLGPVFKTSSDLAEPDSPGVAEFLAQLRRDAIVLYSRPLRS